MRNWQDDIEREYFMRFNGKEEDYSESELEQALVDTGESIEKNQKMLKEMEKLTFCFTFYGGENEIVKERKINFNEITHDYNHPSKESLRDSIHYYRLMYKGNTLCYFAGSGNTSERATEVCMFDRISISEDFFKNFDKRIRCRDDVSISTGQKDIIKYQLEQLK